MVFCGLYAIIRNMEQTSETASVGTPDGVLMAVSDSAAKRIAAEREKQGSPNLMLRVTVLGGGCSGFKYQLDFDDKTAADDVTFRGVVVTDESSLPFLQNALGQLRTDLDGFRLQNRKPERRFILWLRQVVFDKECNKTNLRISPTAPSISRCQKLARYD